MSHTNFLSWLLGAMFAFSVCLTSDLPAQETGKAPSTEQEKDDDSSEELSLIHISEPTRPY